MRIGSSIQWIRQAKKITTIQVAEEAGMSQGYLSMVENNVRIPSLDKLQDICRVLGVPVTMVIMLAEKDHPAIAPYLPLIYREMLNHEIHLTS